MNYLTILLIALLSLASSCQKEDMPADGHKNIFRCKVNGVEWTPQCVSDFFGCSAVDCQYYKGSKTISIVAIREYHDQTIDESVRIYKYGIIEGENPIQQTSGYEYSDQTKNWPCGYYDLDTTAQSSIIIHHVDTVNYIVQGSFEFTAYDRNNSCVDTVHITNGYFDLEYRF